MAYAVGRVCLECESPFHGRVDKKFCGDACRIAYNNKLNSDSVNAVRNINNILRKNRRILVELNPRGKVKVSREKLKAKGFNFGYFTSMHTTKDGSQYYYCYDQGYLLLERDLCLLVVRKN